MASEIASGPPVLGMETVVFVNVVGVPHVPPVHVADGVRRPPDANPVNEFLNESTGYDGALTLKVRLNVPTCVLVVIHVLLKMKAEVEASAVTETALDGVCAPTPEPLTVYVYEKLLNKAPFMMQPPLPNAT
ncbi:MAG: hypothetical protein KGN36_07635 [Acidobacteriota bacterium]|nr:hypothetical protein [Acidobacteriota bacterium]